MKYFLFCITLITFVSSANGKNSVCYGTTSKGRIDNAVQVPFQGKNYVAYGEIPWNLGRTYIHSEVLSILINSYSNLYQLKPLNTYVYAEIGLKEGGQFDPHRTHQNGLSVDLMVPTINSQTKNSENFPMHKDNRWGYDVEFDSEGIYKNYLLDFESLAELIVEIDKATKKSGFKIWRVIFAPDLQEKLYNTTNGNYLKKNIYIPNTPSWVRHDEHIHIDFEIPCKPL